MRMLVCRVVARYLRKLEMRTHRCVLGFSIETNKKNLSVVIPLVEQR